MRRPSAFKNEWIPITTREDSVTSPGLVIFRAPKPRSAGTKDVDPDLPNHLQPTLIFNGM
jgi:hypothetical protein